jgi:hypothetical protein
MELVATAVPGNFPFNTLFQNNLERQAYYGTVSRHRNEAVMPRATFPALAAYRAVLNRSSGDPSFFGSLARHLVLTVTLLRGAVAIRHP